MCNAARKAKIEKAILEGRLKYFQWRVPREMCSYDEAKRIVRELGIKSSSEYRRCEKLPSCISLAPDKTYSEQFEGWKIFLGTRVSFEEATLIVRGLKIRTSIEYRLMFKKKELPGVLPSEPGATYKSEWKGWPDFLGTRLPFKELLRIVQPKCFRTISEYREVAISDLRFPLRPDQVYSQWTGFPAYLGVSVPSLTKWEWRRFYSLFLRIQGSSWKQVANCLGIGVRGAMESAGKAEEDPLVQSIWFQGMLNGNDKVIRVFEEMGHDWQQSRKEIKCSNHAPTM